MVKVVSVEGRANPQVSALLLLRAIELMMRGHAQSDQNYHIRRRELDLTGQIQPFPPRQTWAYPQTCVSLSLYSRGSSGTDQIPAPGACSKTTLYCLHGRQALQDGAHTLHCDLLTDRMWHRNPSDDMSRSRESLHQDHPSRAPRRQALRGDWRRSWLPLERGQARTRARA